MQTKVKELEGTIKFLMSKFPEYNNNIINKDSDDILTHEVTSTGYDEA